MYIRRVVYYCMDNTAAFLFCIGTMTFEEDRFYEVLVCCVMDHFSFYVQIRDQLTVCVEGGRGEGKREKRERGRERERERKREGGKEVKEVKEEEMKEGRGTEGKREKRREGRE